MRLIAPRRRRGERASDCLGFALSFAALALTQTNAVFTLGLLVAPYLVVRISSLAGRLSVPVAVERRFRLLFGALATAGIGVFWAACFGLPFLANVVWCDWPAFKSALAAFGDIASPAFRIDVAQWRLALFVVVGAIASLVLRRWRWLTVAFSVSCVICLVDMAFSGYAKHLLAGFWYTDSTRIAAMTALFAMPLAALGLSSAFCAAWRFARRCAARIGSDSGRCASVSCFELSKGNRALAAAVGAPLALLFVVAVFWPFSPQDPQDPARTAFGAVAGSLASMNSEDAPRVYSPDEAEFVSEVRSLLPEGAMVVNHPDDGSAFAYSVDGLNAYYRYMWTYGAPSETEESRIIRHGLADVAESEQVREALRHVGARYLLLLDQGAMGDEGEDGGDPAARASAEGTGSDLQRRWLFSYYERVDTWSGIERVDDDTPGFTVLAARDDMRLYRIEGV